jgi:hypothetical protein
MTMTDKPDPDGKRWRSRRWAGIAVVLVVAYMGAYYATVVPKPYVPRWGAVHHYEVMACRLPWVADAFFYPAHRIDYLLRPAVWLWPGFEPNSMVSQVYYCQIEGNEN